MTQFEQNVCLIIANALKILAIAFAWPLACLAVWVIVVVLGYFGVNPR